MRIKSISHLIVTLCLLTLSPFDASSYTSQSGQPSSQPTWVHWDVYEIKVDKDGATHTCTITSKGGELLVSIKIRTPVVEKSASRDQGDAVVAKEHKHDFRIDKTDGKVVELSRMNYLETGKGMRSGGPAKTGPTAKVMLGPFKELLQKLPSEIYELMERFLNKSM